MNYLKISFGVFIALAASRFVPHPPNFTSLIALSFYVPVILGTRYISVLLFSFILTDIILGFHSTIFFTWGSVLLIGLISKYFFSTILSRIVGTLFGASLFYVVTNFGVWISGMYGYSFEGLFAAYLLGLPFFGYNLISTFIFSALIETIIKFFKLKFRTS